MMKTTPLSTLEDTVLASINVIEQAQRYVFIRSAILDQQLFEQAQLLEALSSFARYSRYNEVHILVDFPQIILGLSHDLLQLQRRLSQKIIFKTFYDEKDERIPSLIINDRDSFVTKYVRANDGGFSCCDVIETRQQREVFQHAWQQSEISHHLRAMHL